MVFSLLRQHGFGKKGWNRLRKKGMHESLGALQDEKFLMVFEDFNSQFVAISNKKTIFANNCYQQLI